MSKRTRGAARDESPAGGAGGAAEPVWVQARPSAQPQPARARARLAPRRTRRLRAAPHARRARSRGALRPVSSRVVLTRRAAQCDRCKKWRRAPAATVAADDDSPWFCEARPSRAAPRTRARRLARSRTLRC
jgi:hypothetical protein